MIKLVQAIELLRAFLIVFFFSKGIRDRQLVVLATKR